uniref:VWFA domain-containing protein n=1 Tax=Cyprinus carpio TaxID=7962 RepID=A0A8C1QEF3_CYPCA
MDIFLCFKYCRHILKNTNIAKSQRDIVFVLDGSDDTRDSFKPMCQFVQRVVDKLNIGPSRDRVSVVQYSREPQVHFYLNTHATKQDIHNSIESLKHQGGSPLNTGRALDYTKKNMFVASSGSRILEGVPQVLVLVTGGRSQDDVRAPAAALKIDQIVTFSIGNQNADAIQLQAMSYTPGHTLTVPQFDDLQTIEQKLVSYVRRVPQQPRRLTTTTTGVMGYFSRMQNFVQTLVQKLNVAPNKDRVSVVQYSDDAAIEFLLNTYSSSDDVINYVKRLIHKGGRLRNKNGFPAMKEFVQRMVERLDITENRDRVSVVQYSRDAEVHFYLNTYTTKEDSLDGVRGLRRKGGRTLYTGAAIQYVRDNVFTASSGSRGLEGVPQILVLLSGGRSSDSVDAAASSLKELGVLTFGIGSRGSDSRELQRISYDTDFALTASDFSELPNVQEQLLASVQAVPIPVTPTSPTFTGMCMAEF